MPKRFYSEELVVKTQISTNFEHFTLHKYIWDIWTDIQNRGKIDVLYAFRMCLYHEWCILSNLVFL